MKKTYVHFCKYDVIQLPKSELLGIIYLIRVTCYITVEVQRRHPRLNCGYTPYYRRVVITGNV
jgi:hypothetical protein